MHIHRLTDNNKVVSLQKMINFEVPKFEKNIHVFLNICNTVSDNRVLQPRPPLHPLPSRASPVSFGAPPLWIAPPRKKNLATAYSSAPKTLVISMNTCSTPLHNDSIFRSL